MQLYPEGGENLVEKPDVPTQAHGICGLSAPTIQIASASE